MQKILILASKRSVEKEKLTKFLKKYFINKAEVVLAVFSDLIFEIEKGKVLIEINRQNINDFDLIYFRSTTGAQSMAAVLSIYLDKTKVKFFDKSIIEGSFVGDKFSSLMRLAVNNIPIVPSFLCSKGATKKAEKRIIEKFGFPIIAKEITTQRMQSIYLINSIKDFDKLPDKTVGNGNARYLFQKFINFNREYRLLVLGETIGIVHTKTVRDNTGFKLGYQNMDEYPEFIDPKDVSEEIKNTAIKSAKILKIQIAGVDICREVATGKIFVFEVNRGPGIDYDTKVSQELQKIGDFFSSELSIK